MPRTPQLKDPELYDRLREDGASAEKAARISNAAAGEGRSELGRRGYSHLRKAELIKLLREH